MALPGLTSRSESLGRQARALLDDLDQVRRRARGDLHAASVPLSVLGLLALGGALANVADPTPFGFLYWSLAGPAGLFLTAWWFHWLQHRQGAGTDVGSLVTIAVSVTCAAVTAAFLPIGGVITAVGFFARPSPSGAGSSVPPP